MAAFDPSTYPANDLAIADIPLVFRQVQQILEDVLDLEHEDITGNMGVGDGTYTGGEHSAGSAKAYFQTDAPTNRPDGSTALGTNDKGRMWFDDDDTELLYVWDGSAWVSLETIINAMDGLDFASTLDVTGAVTFDSTLAVAGNTTLSGSLTFDSVALTTIDTSGEGSSNDDVSLPTSALVEDLIAAISTTAMAYLGARTSGTYSAPMQAATDGFFTVWTDSRTISDIQVLSDSAATPTTLVGYAHAQDGAPVIACVTVPIRKDDYVKVQGTYTVAYWRWVPLGTGLLS